MGVDTVRGRIFRARCAQVNEKSYCSATLGRNGKRGARSRASAGVLSGNGVALHRVLVPDHTAARTIGYERVPILDLQRLRQQRSRPIHVF